MTTTNTLQKKFFVLVLVTLSTYFIPTQVAQAQGPNAPEAAGFEPVDATDMVNLTNGNLAYVLPLLDVEGFPVTLSYHAGITNDMDASWVGLGWYLNPGAINRSVTNTPDDWKSGVGISFNSFYDEQDYYSVNVSVGLKSGASIGVGLNWGGGQGLSGSVSANFGTISAFVSSDGNVGVSQEILGIQAGPISGGIGLSYSLKNQWSISGSAQISAKVSKGSDAGNRTSRYVGASLSSDGGFSISGGGGNKKSSKTGVRGGGASGSSSSFSQGDASIDQQSMGVSLPLEFAGVPITLGFRKTKVKINIKKGYINKEWGALYSNDFQGLTSESARINSVDNYNPFYSDYLSRNKSMDVYSTRLPQQEEEFIADYSNTIENTNFTFMGYDDYNISAQGLLGEMTPHLFQNATIYGKGEVSSNAEGDPIHAFWHRGTQAASNKTLGNDLHFYFNGQFTSVEKNELAGINSNGVNSINNINSLLFEGNHTGTSTSASYNYRAKSPNHIQVFTNSQIESGTATAQGLITPSTIPDHHRDDIDKFDPNGIGAYKITAPDGKTYHFALPVYHYEQIQRGQINTIENGDFDIDNVNEKRQFSRYATHWLLTAITGPDYFDSNNNGRFDKTDYGYWVELEYGQWSDGYVWRTPYQDHVYQYNTNLLDDIEERDKGSYSFGRKQLYYLDKINTKNRTALFIKELRADNFGKNLKFRYRNNNAPEIGHTGNGEEEESLNFTNPNVHVRENNNGEGVKYKREYSLKLSKIVLVDSDLGKDLSKDSNATNSSNLATPYGRFGNTYSPNATCSPGWESPYFEDVYGPGYQYPIHNEDLVLDTRDVSNGFIENNALKVIEFEHSYDLAKNSASSSELVTSSQNPDNGKLTLQSVHMKGKGGIAYMPPTRFDYFMKDLNNYKRTPVDVNLFGINRSADEIRDEVEIIKNNVDNWGFMQGEHNGENKIKAWSLKQINMPTGAAINIEYEEDDYYTEAFARRYWENEQLEHRFITENNNKVLEFRRDPDDISANDIDLRDYFEVGEVAFLDVVQDRNPPGSGNRRYAYISGAYEVTSVSENSLKFILPDTETHNSFRTSSSCNETPWYATDRYHELGGWQSYFNPSNRSCHAGSGPDHNTLYKFRLVANKVPVNEMGGGLRVKELVTTDGHVSYKTQYDYTHPAKNRSSGITSYAPVDGLKYVPYQSELPAPGVMYEYVTMRETSNSGDFVNETRYRHHVLNPVFNIFNPNLGLETLAGDSDQNGEFEDLIFWAEVTDSYKGLDGNNTHNVSAKKIDIKINTAIIGQMRSIEQLNSFGHVMLKTENEYINGAYLNDSQSPEYEPNKGYVKETFNSMKSVFQTNSDGEVIEDEKRLLSISSRTDYNNMLKKTITHAGGHTSYTEYDDVDPWLGSFRKSTMVYANGHSEDSYRVPAYEKYSNMQSKVLDPTNKNMLTQEAMNITMLGNQTLNASITTWNDNWSYIDESGNSTNANTEYPVWRQHKTFIWRDNINPVTGTYATTVDDNNTYFDWGNGVPTNDNWQEVSEITRYTHWSNPIETKDINTNFASSKSVDYGSKITASGNARHSEMYYSGAEFVASGNLFEGGIGGANYVSDNSAHTGLTSIGLTNASQKAFEINGQVSSSYNDLSKAFRPQTYKISVWAQIEDNFFNFNYAQLILNGNVIPIAESERAGKWVLLNYYVLLEPNTNVNLYFKNNGYYESHLYFDDFRMHPVSSSMSSYVYDQRTDELIAILDANNVATVYCYDNGGRLCTTYTEVFGDCQNCSPPHFGTEGASNENYPEGIGGFKIISKNTYNYLGDDNDNSCLCIGNNNDIQSQ